jgi:2-methylisocitrate lyase-like PEP mutase family enzyme
MNDHEKRARLREILADTKGAIAPGVTDALFAHLVQDCGYPAAHLSGNAIHTSPIAIFSRSRKSPNASDRFRKRAISR